MALARVVTFEGVSSDRLEQMKSDMNSDQPPEGMPATEFIVLHDPAEQKSVVILFFENEDDYKQGDEMLNAMPTSDTPGTRTSVAKFDVAMRMTT